MLYLKAVPFELQEFIPLAPYTTLGVGGPARFFCEVHSEAEVEQATQFAGQRDLPLFVLGGGSNLLVERYGFDGVVDARWRDRLEARVQGRGQPAARSRGGRKWDDVVLYTVDRGYAGIECLAGIPGDVGGTPVQNVGAYGQEVAETILQVRAYDLETRTFVDLDHEALPVSATVAASLIRMLAGDTFVIAVTLQSYGPVGEPACAMPMSSVTSPRRWNEEKSLRSARSTIAVRSIREQKGMLRRAGRPGRPERRLLLQESCDPSGTLPQIALRAACSARKWCPNIRQEREG